jgi:hypothetical protein
MTRITEAIEAAAEQIVKSLGLLESAIEPLDVYDLTDGGIALIVLENELILGEVRQKTAHMDTYEVLNVDVAGTQVYHRTYFYDGRPSVAASDIDAKAVYVSR